MDTEVPDQQHVLHLHERLMTSSEMYLEPLENVPEFFPSDRVESEFHGSSECHFLSWTNKRRDYICTIVGLHRRPDRYTFGPQVRWLCTKEKRAIEGWKLRYLIDNDYYMYEREK